MHEAAVCTCGDDIHVRGGSVCSILAVEDRKEDIAVLYLISLRTALGTRGPVYFRA